MKLLIVDPKKRLTVYQALSNNWLLGKATKMETLTVAMDNMRVIVNRKKTQVKNLILCFNNFNSSLKLENF